MDTVSLHLLISAYEALIKLQGMKYIPIDREGVTEAEVAIDHSYLVQSLSAYLMDNTISMDNSMLGRLSIAIPIWPGTGLVSCLDEAATLILRRRTSNV